MKQDQRLTRGQKNKKNKAWYKDKATSIDVTPHDIHGAVSDRRKMKVNYDIFNNILNLSEFNYVCKPFGQESGELPAKMVNRDISSAKIKKVLGKAQKRAFNYKAVAVNPEATSRREKVEFEKIHEYVIGEIMSPIEEEIRTKAAQQEQEQQLSEEQRKAIQEQVAKDIKAATPEEVKEYMQRKHQDPAEIMSHQLLKYLTKKCDLKRKFDDALKHGLLSARGVMYVGILNGEPEVWNVNSLDFRYNKSPLTPFIEDGESASCTYRMTPSQILKYFGDEIKDKKDIDLIYSSVGRHASGIEEEDLFSIHDLQDDTNQRGTLDVVHCVWKSLRRIGFLTYIDEKGKEQSDIVDESYKLDPDNGDVKIEWEWYPEVYETWIIKASERIYTKMQPIPGQFKDLDDLYHCKLPYYGVVYDDMNSKETSLMDRILIYQYYYNIVMYRIELLMASDKGKKVAMNIANIPDSAGINMKQWQYFMESSPYMWFDNSEEGKTQIDANNVAKVIDLSLASDIQKYMDIAEYLRIQCGRSVGIPDELEGQINPRQANATTQQVIEQTSDILEPYYNLHDLLKRNVLTGLLECAKVAYAGRGNIKLPFVLDDMSIEMLDIDMPLLDSSKLGIFIAEGGMTEEVLQTLKQLTHAAMQTQKIELSDVISTLKKDNLSDAEAGLRASEIERFEREQAAQDKKLKAAAQEEDKKRQREREKHEEAKELTILKEEERRKTVLAQAAITGASFNPDADADNDGKNDFVELAQAQLDNGIKMSAQQLDREKFEHQKQTDNKKLQQEDQKLKQSKSK